MDGDVSAAVCGSHNGNGRSLAPRQGYLSHERKPMLCQLTNRGTNFTKKKRRVNVLHGVKTPFNCKITIKLQFCHKPNCEGPGSGCHDPRFIGADGAVFYFHGRKDEHFSLVSDPHLQINARFIGLRPAGRTRDFTWIQALGFMYGSHNFTVEAAHVKQWSNDVDHLKFSYDGKPLLVPEGHLSHWKSPDTELTLERTGTRNSIMVVLEGIAEAMLKVVPITKEDDELHNYQIPSDDSYAHLEVQFRFFGLSPQVEGVLGRTYRPDYENTVKRGVLMPVVGGEDKYKTSSLLSADCKLCSFSLKEDNEIELRILR
ncbi:uncharacterized protein LOC120110001 [Phoenix dactylifera]|uniref:Uncharacterized protein LOC120110001 n=1 Tax=Phoenix dactylifera TaxID=42345 RepID=A0A8B9A2L0_PHODC|nr:uncharacterized protein LOC120110001 [Phoenix dactylifera]